MIFIVQYLNLIHQYNFFSICQHSKFAHVDFERKQYRIKLYDTGPSIHRWSVGKKSYVWKHFSVKPFSSKHARNKSIAAEWNEKNTPSMIEKYSHWKDFIIKQLASCVFIIWSMRISLWIYFNFLKGNIQCNIKTPRLIQISMSNW